MATDQMVHEGPVHVTMAIGSELYMRKISVYDTVPLNELYLPQFNRPRGVTLRSSILGLGENIKIIKSTAEHHF